MRSRDIHASKVMTPRQEQRVRAGQLESSVTDYMSGTEEQRKAGIARRKAEDLKLAKELEL